MKTIVRLETLTIPQFHTVLVIDLCWKKYKSRGIIDVFTRPCKIGEQPTERRIYVDSRNRVRKIIN
ncbi:hypothetical protein TRIP_D170019 [uncultured Paludibacter sp.]|nr:hypothetical protein TRIP_D170019 [uncultured Paludibacter sp.]